MLFTAFRTWPLEQLCVCVWSRFTIFYILAKPNHLLSPNANWDGRNLHTDVSGLQNKNTRAPPATNYRNWNSTLARRGQVQNPPHLLWLIKSLLLFLLSAQTCFLKSSEDVVYREGIVAGSECFGVTTPSAFPSQNLVSLSVFGTCETKISLKYSKMFSLVVSCCYLIAKIKWSREQMEHGNHLVLPRSNIQECLFSSY